MVRRLNLTANFDTVRRAEAVNLRSPFVRSSYFSAAHYVETKRAPLNCHTRSG